LKKPGYPQCLTNVKTLKEIESAIEALPKKNFARLASWMDSLVHKRWDKQLEMHAKSGKLDAV